jgi:hypothetical protein
MILVDEVEQFSLSLEFFFKVEKLFVVVSRVGADLFNL